MNTLSQFFAHPVFEAIGWALLHSVWQGLLLALLLRLILNFIPSRRAILRYSVSLAGLAGVLLAGIATVWFLLPKQVPQPSHAIIVTPVSVNAPMAISLPALSQVAAYIEHQMPLILTAWIAGVVICTLRLAMGWMYISRLKRTALPVSDPWYDMMDRLASQLRLTRFIQLSESVHINSPVVVGVFKPIILVPVGMFTGLSPQQVEAVLLHELAHIRRHDFMVNLLQSLMEVIYFFNPFVWIISSMVRNEREFCCDDEVVRQYNPRIYAEALAYLETSRAAKSVLALSLTGGKNNLLHRIKRFMEKSKQNNPVAQWAVPVTLVVIGFASMSWLKIGSDPAENEAMMRAETAFSNTIPQDTIDDPDEKSATYSIRKSITIDENGEPHEETVEKFEGDEELRELADKDFNFDFDLSLDSSLFTYSFEFDTMTGLDVFNQFPPTVDFHFENFAFSDSLPHPPQPPWWDPEDFRLEFESMFKEKFSDFYREHQKDMEVMMDQLEEKFQHFNADTAWQQNLQRSMQEVERNMQKLREKMQKAHEKDGKAMIQHSRAMQEHQARMLALQQKLQADQHLRQQKELAAAHAKMELAREKMQKQVEKQHTAMEKLRKQLIEDGYLEKDEPLKSLHWSNDSMKVNGKEVKPKDVKRYKKLNDDWVDK